MSANLGATHRLNDSVTAATAGLNQQFESFAMGGALGVNSEGGMFAGLSLTLSFGRHPWSGDLRLSPGGQAQTGGIAARAFIDKNNNGEFDEDDEPVSDVRFVTGGQRQRSSTNEAGEVFISELPLYENLDVVVQRGSVSDPYLTSSREGYSVALRPGVYPQLDFPLVTTGEIDGMVVFGSVEDESLVGNIELELLDENSEVVATTRTEFDGFYLFELIPLGHYRVRVAQNVIERFATRKAQSQKLQLTDAEPVMSGVNLHLTNNQK